MSSKDVSPIYVVEHLATFSNSMPSQQPITPKIAIQRLFSMEKTSGIWTQRMTLKIDCGHMLIVDGDTNDVVERFPVSLIQQPISFNYRDHMYNNILIFTVQHPDESQGELHIFQCVSDSAQQIADEIRNWMKKHGNVDVGDAQGHDTVTGKSAANVHVKETVNAFNALAAQREKKPSSPVVNHSSSARRSPLGSSSHQIRDHDSRSVTTTSSIDSVNNGTQRPSSHDQSLSTERYVSILNHCFDDVERFILRIQHVAAAVRELQIRNTKRQGKNAAHSGDGLLALRARTPPEEEFYEILSKFKLAFNLLAKLKGCIHDPNAPELVHFLFTPLAMIIEAARNTPGPNPIDPSVVGVPFLNSEAIELLSNCCTSKEYDLWQALGPNWTHSVRHQMPPIRLNGSSYQPVFSDGWTPNITEPELMGFTSSSETSEHEDVDSIQRESATNSAIKRDYGRHHMPHYIDSDIDEHSGGQSMNSPHIKSGPSSAMHSGGGGGSGIGGRHGPPSPIDSIERDSPTVSHLNEIEQSEWLTELQSRGARIVQVLFPRIANNEKELTVAKGEILEILDSSRNWWKARNSQGQIAHVPNTIIDEVHFRDRMSSHMNRGSPEDWIRKERQGKKGEFRYF